MAHELQQLYNSEINFSISTFWDNGFFVRLGDRLNGYPAQANVATFDEAVTWLRGQARIHFPQSEYVRNLPQ
jgi:hypothetical protein